MSDSGVHRVNRRLNARVACRLAVSYLAGGQWHPATAMDLSNTGCRLRLGEDLPRGSSLRVRIDPRTIAGKPMRAELEGSVVWSRLEGLSYQVGIHFTSDDDMLHRIMELLSEPVAVELPPAALEPS
jgi:PilZ domain